MVLEVVLVAVVEVGELPQHVVGPDAKVLGGAVRAAVPDGQLEGQQARAVELVLVVGYVLAVPIGVVGQGGMNLHLAVGLLERDVPPQPATAAVERDVLVVPALGGRVGAPVVAHVVGACAHASEVEVHLGGAWVQGGHVLGNPRIGVGIYAVRGLAGLVRVRVE